MQTTATVPVLLTQAEMCKLVGKSEAWAERARWVGDGPPYVKLGRHVRYRATDLTAWIESNIRTSTSGSAK